MSFSDIASISYVSFLLIISMFKNKYLCKNIRIKEVINSFEY
jgi:hypothetical protein